eukprot:153130-Pyramimonas_sp.AAC.1
MSSPLKNFSVQGPGGRESAVLVVGRAAGCAPPAAAASLCLIAACFFLRCLGFAANIVSPYQFRE